MKKFNILCIEDSLPDFQLLEKALKKIENVDLNIINIVNGQEAIDFIYQKKDFTNYCIPDLIILDLNLPIKDGYYVLDNIKKNEKYKTIPIIIYTTSDETSDIWSSYSKYANSYITKGFDLKDIFDKISTFGEYWLKTAILPDSKNMYHFSKNKKENNNENTND